MAMRPKPVVLISGTPGVGKSTLARQLSCEFGFNHRIGTGWIRETLRSVLDEEQHPALFASIIGNQTAEETLNTFQQRCALLRAPIMACTERAKRDGTSLIIEGGHVLPELAQSESVDLFILLVLRNRTIHHTGLAGDSHRFRHVTDTDYENAIFLQNHLLALAQEVDSPKILIVEYERHEEIFPRVQDRVAALVAASEISTP